MGATFNWEVYSSSAADADITGAIENKKKKTEK